MKISRRTLPLGAKTSLALLALASLSILPAQAQVSVTYDLGAFSFTQTDISGGSGFTLADTGQQALTLQPGVVFLIDQSVNFVAGGNPNFTTDDSVSSFGQTIVVNSISKTATRNYDVTTGVDSDLLPSDSLLLYPTTTPTIFDLGSQGTVAFNLRSYDDSNEPGYQSYAGTTQASFLYTPAAAPEPSQFAVLGLGLLSLGCLALRTRSKHVQGNI